MLKMREISFLLASFLIGCISLVLIKTTVYAENFFDIIIRQWKYAPLLLTPCGFFIIVYFIQRFFNGAQGSGIPNTLRALELPNTSKDCRPYLTLRILLGKLFIIPAYLCGGSLGYEGPSIQIGATVMALFHKYLKLSADEVRYAFIMSGAAAALGATLSAPLTGIMFAIEEFSRYIYKSSFISYIIIAVIISCYITYMTVGHYTFISHPAIDTTDLNLNNFYGCLFIPICGVIGGITGSIFSKCLIYTTKIISTITKKYALFIAAITGLLVGIISVITYGYTAGCGESAIRNIIFGHYVPIIYAPLKMLATLLTYLSGVPTGLFTPSIAIGAILSQMLIPILPVGVDAHAIIYLMMAAYLCGVLQAPLTCCALVMEITGQDSLLLPLIATAIIAKTVASVILKVPIYESLSLLLPKKTSEIDAAYIIENDSKTKKLTAI